MRVAVAAAAACLLLVSCGDGGGRGAARQAKNAVEPAAEAPPPGAAPGEARPEGIGPRSVMLLPASPTAASDLRAVYTGGGGGVATFRWTRNGEAVGADAGDTLPRGSFRKGDTVAVTVSSGGAELSAAATIGNSPPAVANFRRRPAVIFAGSDVAVETEGVDPDGDRVSFEYRWAVNGVPAPSGEDGALKAGLFKRGDVLSLTVTPSDGAESGEPYSPPDETVRNSPPSFTSTPPASFPRVYSYQASAVDADGDDVTFSLAAGPAGMSVSPGGLVQWEVKPEDRGVHAVGIAADDGHGARTLQEFRLTVERPE